MKRLLLLVCVVSVVLLAGCDVWDLLSSSPDVTEVMEELEQWMAYSDYTIMLRVRRYGTQQSATNPIAWSVEGDIELSMRPFTDQDMFLFGDAQVANAGWTFSGGGCEGMGDWPVRLFVVGFLYGEPECFIRLNVVETWIGGNQSVMTCAGAGASSVVNDTLGYRFENVTFNTSNAFSPILETAGIPSPGAAADDFSGWEWSSSWEIADINAPEITGCTFDFGS